MMHVDVVLATGLQSSSLSVQLLVLVFRVGGEHLGPFHCRASTPFAGDDRPLRAPQPAVDHSLPIVRAGPVLGCWFFVS